RGSESFLISSGVAMICSPRARVDFGRAGAMVRPLGVGGAIGSLLVETIRSGARGRGSMLPPAEECADVYPSVGHLSLPHPPSPHAAARTSRQISTREIAGVVGRR